MVAAVTTRTPQDKHMPRSCSRTTANDFAHIMSADIRWSGAGTVVHDMVVLQVPNIWNRRRIVGHYVLIYSGLVLMSFMRMKVCSSLLHSKCV